LQANHKPQINPAGRGGRRGVTRSTKKKKNHRGSTSYASGAAEPKMRGQPLRNGENHPVTWRGGFVSKKKENILN